MTQRRRSLIALVLIISALLVWLQPAAVGAQEPTEGRRTITWPLSALNDIDTLRLEGYRPVASFSLTLPPGWQPATDGQLLLDYRLSDLVSQGSSLTIRLNSQNIHSVDFTENSGSLRVNLPANYLRAGLNEVDLLAFLPLRDEPDCVEPDHPARWLDIDTASQIILSLEPTSGPLDLATFPLHFRSFDDFLPFEMSFVIPDLPNQDELNALSALTIALAGDKGKGSDWRVIPQREFNPNQLTGPVVLLGTTDRNQYLENLAPSQDPGVGWLRLTRQEWSNGQPVLAVGGPDGPSVLKAARALADPIARLQMNNDLALIEDLPSLTVVSPPESFSLAELGYSQRTVHGTGQQSLVYTFDIPFSWRLRRGQMTLQFSHTTLLYPDLGTLNVYLNGNTIADLILNSPDSDMNTVEFALPEAFLRPGRNFLRLAFDFGQPISICGFESDQEPWGSVSADTRIGLPHSEQGGRLDLRDYPYQFASASDLSQLVIVLPNELENSDIIDALAIIRSLPVPGSGVTPRLMPASALDAAAKAAHLIVLGDMSRQNLLAELNPHLPLPFDFSGNRQLPTYGIRLPEKSSSLGIIQLLRSPWQANRMVLVVSGEGKSEYQNAIQMLINPIRQAALADQLLWVTSGVTPEDFHIHTQTVPDIEAVPGLSQLDRLMALSLADRPALTVISLITIGLIVLTIAITLGFRWYRLWASNAGRS